MPWCRFGRSRSCASTRERPLAPRRRLRPAQRATGRQLVSRALVPFKTRFLHSSPSARSAPCIIGRQGAAGSSRDILAPWHRTTCGSSTTGRERNLLGTRAPFGASIVKQRRQDGVKKHDARECGDHHRQAGASDGGGDGHRDRHQRNHDGIDSALRASLLGRQRMKPLRDRRAAVHGPKDQTGSDHQHDERQQRHDHHPESLRPFGNPRVVSPNPPVTSRTLAPGRGSLAGLASSAWWQTRPSHEWVRYTTIVTMPADWLCAEPSTCPGTPS